jgi:STE24 endopeptidase
MLENFVTTVGEAIYANIIFQIIIFLLLFDFVFERILDYLNFKRWGNKLPQEVEGIYDEEKYKQSQEYEKTNYKFSLITSIFSLILMLGMLLLDGFAFVDQWVRQFTDSKILIALLFFGVLGIASDIISMPFSLYKIFVIEEKFGFNKTSISTFFLDKIKSYLLGGIIGGTLFALFIWFYESSGEYFWLYAWFVFTAFSVLMIMFYSSLIVPLFNKLTPLPEGELRKSIEEYCKKVGFKLDNLFVIDGSKRSTKSNAYFSGIGPKKRIVLYDTLINDHTTEELVGVLAHEAGHYKKKHIIPALVLGIIQSGVMLFVLSLFINNPSLSFALGVEVPSFHIAILTFGILYSPLSMLLGIGMNMLSRKNEFEADRFAAETYASKPLQTALIKLSVKHLSNLNPHPAYVFIHYSHPTLLQRLKQLKKYE